MKMTDKIRGQRKNDLFIYDDIYEIDPEVLKETIKRFEKIYEAGKGSTKPLPDIDFDFDSPAGDRMIKYLTSKWIEVSKQEFDDYMDLFSGEALASETIRFSSPTRYNFFHEGVLISYKYDSYGEEYPETYHVMLLE